MKEGLRFILLLIKWFMISIAMFILMAMVFRFILIPIIDYIFKI